MAAATLIREQVLKSHLHSSCSSFNLNKQESEVLYTSLPAGWCSAVGLCAVSLWVTWLMGWSASSADGLAGRAGLPCRAWRVLRITSWCQPMPGVRAWRKGWSRDRWLQGWAEVPSGAWRAAMQETRPGLSSAGTSCSKRNCSWLYGGRKIPRDRVDAAWSRGPARLQHPLVREPPVPVPLRSVIADHCDHAVRMFIAYVQSLYWWSSSAYHCRCVCCAVGTCGFKAFSAYRITLFEINFHGLVVLLRFYFRLCCQLVYFWKSKPIPPIQRRAKFCVHVMIKISIL